MMIYVLGMSHAINVLKAASHATLTLSHENWTEQTVQPQFVDLHTKPGLFQGDLIRAFIVTPACGWGLMAELRTQANGQQTIVGVEGYINLLNSLHPEQEDGCLFSFVHGNEHSMLSMVQHPQRYDFILPGRPDLDIEPGYQPIPYEVARRQVVESLSATIGCLAMMRLKLPTIRLVHVLPPAPIASQQQIMQSPEIFKEQLATFGITPISIRIKYYELSTDVLRQALIPYQIELLENPTQARSADGALKDEYAYAATHANEAFGALVVDQMRALVNQER